MSGYALTEDYDKFTAKTSVCLSLARNPTYVDSLEPTFCYSYPGTTPTLPAAVTIWLHRYAENWAYLNCHGLTLLVDGSVRIPVDTQFKGEVVTSPSILAGHVREDVIGSISTREFLRLVNADRVEAKLCGTEFQIRTEHLKALREMASRMEP